MKKKKTPRKCLHNSISSFSVLITNKKKSIYFLNLHLVPIHHPIWTASQYKDLMPVNKEDKEGRLINSKLATTLSVTITVPQK